MQPDRNVNINIRDNRGISTLAGIVIVLVLTRLWWTGSLADLFAVFYSPRGEGMESATYTIVAFIANVIYGIGTVAVLVWSGVWWLIRDVVEAVRQYAKERSAKRQVVDEIADQQINATTGQAPLIEILQIIESNMQTMADKLDEVDARISMAEESLAKKPATKTAAKPKA